MATLATVAGVSDDQAETDAPDGADLQVPCGAMWEHLPAPLKDDLRALRELPPGERPEAALEIRRHALAGEYGPRVQNFAAHRREVRGRIWAHLPPELRQDIKAARELAPEERRAAFEDIRAGALAGDYGERVQEVAERIQHRRAVCGEPAA